MKDMARPRNTVVRNVEFDMNVLLETISKKTDNELATWFRKAVYDCTNGCTAQDVDPFIKESYKASFAKMIARQNIDAQKYKNKLAREGKSITASINDQVPAEVSTRPVIRQHGSRKPVGHKPTTLTEMQLPATELRFSTAAKAVCSSLPPSPTFRRMPRTATPGMKGAAEAIPWLL